MVAILLLLSQLCNGPPDRVPAAPDGLPSLVGRWTLRSMSVDGKPAEKEYVGALQLRIAADGGYEMIARDSTVVRGKILKLDDKAKPSLIDWNIASRNEFNGKFWPVSEQKGIFEIDGGRMRLCFARSEKGKRPTKFESPKDGGLALYEWKRSK